MGVPVWAAGSSEVLSYFRKYFRTFVRNKVLYESTFESTFVPCSCRATCTRELLVHVRKYEDIFVRSQ